MKKVSDAEFEAWCARNKPCRYCRTWFFGPSCPECEGPKPLPSIPAAIEPTRKYAKPQGNRRVSGPRPIPAAIKPQVTLALSNKRRRSGV